MEQRNDNTNYWKSIKNRHSRFEKIRPECQLMSTSQNVSNCTVVTVFTGRENLRDVLLGNWHYLRTKLFLG